MAGIQYTLIDMSGQIFGRLHVMYRFGKIGKATAWACICECGELVVVTRHNLINGRTQSCGCYNRECITKHGETGTPTLNSWNAMWVRCTQPERKDWKYYGGRGIKVCDRWKSYETFKADMGMRPADKTLDRYPDVNGNYEPGNCRWATKIEQANNTRKSLIKRSRGSLCE